MDIKDRLDKNKLQIQEVQAKLKQLERSQQQLLQELLRLDGEYRLLMELGREQPKEE